MVDKHCEYVKDGKRCKGWKITGSKYCFTHTDDPSIVAMREKALQKASESHKLYIPTEVSSFGEPTLDIPKCVDLTKAKGIKKAYVVLIRAAVRGGIDERKLGALVYALNGYVNAIDKIDLLQRIEKLECVAKGKGLRNI